MKEQKNKRTTVIILIGSLILAVLMIGGTILMGQNA